MILKKIATRGPALGISKNKYQQLMLKQEIDGKESLSPEQKGWVLNWEAEQRKKQKK